MPPSQLKPNETKPPRSGRVRCRDGARRQRPSRLRRPASGPSSPRDLKSAEALFPSTDSPQLLGTPHSFPRFSEGIRSATLCVLFSWLESVVAGRRGVPWTAFPCRAPCITHEFGRAGPPVFLVPTVPAMHYPEVLNAQTPVFFSFPCSAWECSSRRSSVGPPRPISGSFGCCSRPL